MTTITKLTKTGVQAMAITIFKRFLILGTLTTSALIMSVMPPTLAELFGQLTGKLGSQVTIYSQPSTQSSSPHYGLVGDGVSVLKTTKGDDGYTWHLVQFPKSKAQGWVREDQIRMVSY